MQTGECCLGAFGPGKGLGSLSSLSKSLGFIDLFDTAEAV